MEHQHTFKTTTQHKHALKHATEHLHLPKHETLVVAWALALHVLSCPHPEQWGCRYVRVTIKCNRAGPKSSSIGMCAARVPKMIAILDQSAVRALTLCDACCTQNRQRPVVQRNWVGRKRVNNAFASRRSIMSPPGVQCSAQPKLTSNALLALPHLRVNTRHRRGTARVLLSQTGSPKVGRATDAAKRLIMPHDRQPQT